ncbi:FAD-dependent oxidoreductase [Mediterraneibacter sp. NSJ-55]|uniref:FAD-dependent oxidoreductase n=1 Tax=Mediterraneibacter hominis TaxID=2763054 RepID=A0A923RRF8_9FIRM|nr:FAD-dependent oxidoreductase [Mediterraneibacter hominis]MBC5689658.1 FAD-dependent oxidoreductase [Mediterraneibacter hominis]
MVQKTKYINLFTPFKVGKLQIKNRICYAPVGTGLSENGSSAFDAADSEFYVERAKGGAGLITTGAIFTDLEVDTYTPGALGTWQITYKPALFRLTSNKMLDRIHSFGTKMFAQLSLGTGRDSGSYAPSAIPVFADPSKVCPVLSEEQIQKKIRYLIEGAVIAKQSGFDGVEVHALHFGYLLDELAMKISNYRTDAYGGSFENRMRACKEIIEGIKARCGKDFPVSMRLGMKSYITGFNQSCLSGENEAGRTLEDSIRICKTLEEYGYDMLSVDVGLYDSYYYCYPPMYLPLGLNVNLAAACKAAVNIPVAVCGRMNDPELCEETIASGKADAVVIGRQMLADADFALKIKTGRTEDIRPCLSCNFGCRGKMQDGLGQRCAVNPELRRESEPGLVPVTECERKNIMVIGGGVAGMEAARAAACRGHKVTVYEKESKLGGMLNIAGIPDFKEDERKLVAWYEKQLKDLGVNIVLNQEVDMDMILRESPDAVVSAVGAIPFVPGSTKVDHPKAVGFKEALTGEQEIGQKVVVVGGGLVGCEVAVNFVRQGRDVTIVEFLDDILSSGAPTPLMNKMCLADIFRDSNVKIRTSSALTEVNSEGAVIRTSDGFETIPADTVILALGLRSREGFAAKLEEYNIEAYSIGDESQAANILHAIADGYEVGRLI